MAWARLRELSLLPVELDSDAGAISSVDIDGVGRREAVLADRSIVRRGDVNVVEEDDEDDVDDGLDGCDL